MPRELWVHKAAGAALRSAMDLFKAERGRELDAAEGDLPDAELGVRLVLDKRHCRGVAALPEAMGDRMVVIKDAPKSLTIWASRRHLPELLSTMTRLLIDPDVAIRRDRVCNLPLAQTTVFDQATGYMISPDTSDPDTETVLKLFADWVRWVGKSGRYEPRLTAE